MLKLRAFILALSVGAITVAPACAQLRLPPVTPPDIAPAPPGAPPASAPQLLAPGQPALPPPGQEIIQPVPAPPPEASPRGDILAPFQHRANGFAGQPTLAIPPQDAIPNGFVPWWQERVARPLRHGQPLTVDVSRLVMSALSFSQQIQAINAQPLIRQTAVLEAEGDFDVQAFLDSKLVRTSEPVGDTLTTGGPPRFRENNWGYTAGLRKKTRYGGQLEMRQRIGYQHNNSLFLLPPEQGNARLTLSFEQPLLNGAGKAYNNSLIVLAEIDTRVAWDKVSEELQEYLVDVNQAYWELYLQRASLLQTDRWYHRAVEIQRELEVRREIDSMKSQIVRARAAVASRRANLVRSAAAIRNAEARLRALVNDPGLLPGAASGRPTGVELVPVEPPGCGYVPLPIAEALRTALQNRPEIDQALLEMDAASVRLDMSRNELLPALSLIVETYVAGLEGNSQIGQAWANQFNQGEPGFTAGFLFEVPLQNRAAKARYERRQLEVRQLMHQFNATVETLMAEVEVAVREVNTSFREMHSKFAAMMAAQADVDYMKERWRLLPGDDRSASFALEDLLDAQDRLAGEEFGFAEAQVSYVVALAALKRATGVLLKHEAVGN